MKNIKLIMKLCISSIIPYATTHTIGNKFLFDPRYPTFNIEFIVTWTFTRN